MRDKFIKFNKKKTRGNHFWLPFWLGVICIKFSYNKPLKHREEHIIKKKG